MNTKLNRVFKCPDCGKPTISLSHLFQPPAKDDLKKWVVVKLLVDNGFTYDHVYATAEMENGVVTSWSGYAQYPDNLKDAKEFIEKFQYQVKRVK